MFLAFRSRKLKFGEVRTLNKHIFTYFLKHPLIFFLPIRSTLDESSKKLMEDSTKHTNH
jgi:site-specific recombinase